MLQIDPGMWVLALPVAFAMGHLALLPAEHPLREHFDRLLAYDGEVMTRLFGTPLDRAWHGTWWVLTLALAASGLASLGAWLGVIG